MVLHRLGLYWTPHYNNTPRLTMGHTGCRWATRIPIYSGESMGMAYKLKTITNHPHRIQLFKTRVVTYLAPYLREESLYFHYHLQHYQEIHPKGL